MKKFLTDCTIGILVFSFPIFWNLLTVSVSEISGTLIYSEESVGGTPMHKAQLTQKGYIQFLKWELPVPEFNEFTFCLWVKSYDLKYPHSIFSYSKNERERLIRSWISSRGRSIHLEINGTEILRRSVHIQEHRWYHICQSWENRYGRYALWLDGRLELQGQSEETMNRIIPSGGDIVLGQEYTDFDKGLEEGIEGSVLGFNLLLASAFNSLDGGYQRPSFRSTLSNPVELSANAGILTRITRQDTNLPATSVLDRLVSHRFALSPNWSRKIFRIRTKAVESSETSSQSYLPIVSNETRLGNTARIDGNAITFGIDDSIGEIAVESPDAPLGLQLVKLSYVRCQLGRGSPPVGGPLMLISWSRTPVKVFGGAIIKNVGEECGNF